MRLCLSDYLAADAHYAVASLHEDHASIRAIVRPLAISARCPRCHQPSCHLQSRYQRQVADLPIGGKVVHLRVWTRRFHCHTTACAQRIFSEQHAGLAERYSRRTVRLRLTLRQIGFAVGGEVGARLASQLGMPVSPATLLRLVRTAALPVATPRILGVDDFAWKRGSRYGTLLYDVEQRCPLALLPDRTGQTRSRPSPRHFPRHFPRY